MARRKWIQAEEEILASMLPAGAEAEGLVAALHLAGYTDRDYDSVRLKVKRMRSGEANHIPAPDFEVGALPSELPTAAELLARRETDFERKHRAKVARKLIPVDIRLHGPVGIAHMGDTHLDDDGTDIAKVRRHVDVLSRTDGMLVGNVGDLQNNWVGRLAHLYGQQSLSAAEAWVLVEWLVRRVPWLYLVGGNHDVWSGAGDPLKWIAKHSGQVYEPHGARMGLRFPNGKEVRINARHNWPGHSQWNAAHGVGKAIQMGVRDHIVTCGHTHVSGYMPLKDPANGLISHGLQVASYKTYDRYADERALRDQTIFMCPVTIIRPEFADDDPRLVTTFFDPEEAAEYLTYLRSRKAA